MNKLEQLSKLNIEKIHHIRHRSDGTYYDVLVLEFNGTFGNCQLGYGTDALLVIANRGAYIFRKNGYLSIDYLQEKLKIHSTTDAKNFKDTLLELKLVK